MFESEGRLPIGIAPERYSRPESLADELAALFDSAWHYVGPRTALDSDGDFLTETVCGSPVVLWRTAGRVRAFLNVCPHRFATVAAGAGNAARMRCPYHGWEFCGDGTSRKIPRAAEFRPLDATVTSLTEFPVEALGPSLFVKLVDVAGRVEKCPWADLVAEAFPGDRRPVYRGKLEVAANWKLVIENALESYHVDEVHASTFGAAPPAEACSHRFGDGWSTFETAQEPVGRVQKIVDGVVYPLTGSRQDRRYLHVAVYPGLMFGRAGLISWMQSVRPRGPEATEVSLDVYAERPARGAIARGVARLFAAAAVRFSVRALREDAAVVSRVQSGIRSPRLPSRGVLSSREERIHHFHSWYLAAFDAGDASSIRPGPDGFEARKGFGGIRSRETPGGPDSPALSDGSGQGGQDAADGAAPGEIE